MGPDQMAQHPTHDRLAMSGNVEGFKLPMGCLMTSAFILLPILTMGVGLSSADGVSDMVFAVLIPTCCISIFVLGRRIAVKELG